MLRPPGWTAAPADRLRAVIAPLATTTALVGVLPAFAWWSERRDRDGQMADETAEDR